MTTPLRPPPKKNPERRTLSPTIPPQARSRAAMGLTAAAAEGRFAMQVCGECGAVLYPARDACNKCLSVELSWQDVDPRGELLAETTVRTSTNLYFRERAPWRAGTVRLDAGPIIICHIHGDVPPRARVVMTNRLDRAGQGVLLAMPETPAPDMEDDPQLRAMTSDPKLRRVLIVDGRSDNAPAIAKALHKAGATTIFVGEAEGWRPNPHRAALQAVPGVQVLPLDVTDSASIRELAGEIGGKVDILINNARFIRPGGVLARGDTAFAQQEFDVNVMGLMRLAQAFGPGMCARTADGVNSAVAWVNILSAYALVNMPEFGSFAASQAAALSLGQSLRGEFRDSGLRVMHVFVGPTEDDWHQPLPPPKVAPGSLANDLVKGLQAGLEDVYCGDVAKELVARFRAGPKVLEREMTMGGRS
ncbi:SDR family NAD(P)-dependent oxidoreductase [Paracoccus xiamenensis]|uniref:SDR family NAD(P)-dependent oxidoreductase n=1 Tax=Paracoccus xiamenensis TaxID=2714901 RepID=UPI00140C190A|nr:SDR family NAD(P)-dependent oxidoreductase [Paracoccus xiamenensis]NHF72866.1 SDR family NAD(P)-dependent oxidoreductase [Paracoccus xiamenensis]